MYRTPLFWYGGKKRNSGTTFSPCPCRYGWPDLLLIVMMQVPSATSGNLKMFSTCFLLCVDKKSISSNTMRTFFSPAAEDIAFCNVITSSLLFGGHPKSLPLISPYTALGSTNEAQFIETVLNWSFFSSSILLRTSVFPLPGKIEIRDAFRKSRKKWRKIPTWSEPPLYGSPRVTGNFKVY